MVLSVVPTVLQYVKTVRAIKNRGLVWDSVLLMNIFIPVCVKFVLTDAAVALIRTTVHLAKKNTTGIQFAVMIVQVVTKSAIKPTVAPLDVVT